MGGGGECVCVCVWRGGMSIRVGWSWLGTGICERNESAQERRIALYKKQSS